MAQKKIHELAQAASASNSDVLAIDTGSVTYKIPVSLLPWLLKTGGTMSGTLTFNGGDLKLGTTGSSTDDSGDLSWHYGDGNEKGRIWMENAYSAKSGPSYRVLSKSGTVLYSGKLATGDGSGITDAPAFRSALGMRTGTMVKTFASGKVSVALSEFGLSAKPNVVILTLSSNASTSPATYDTYLSYAWDESDNSQITIYGYKGGSTPIAGYMRFSYLIIP